MIVFNAISPYWLQKLFYRIPHLVSCINPLEKAIREFFWFHSRRQQEPCSYANSDVIKRNMEHLLEGNHDEVPGGNNVFLEACKGKEKC